MRFSPFDFDVATSPEEQEAAARRFRPAPPVPDNAPEAPDDSGLAQLGGGGPAEQVQSAR